MVSWWYDGNKKGTLLCTYPAREMVGSVVGV
jgi:hypothetical protein